jgi:hypothetical protein
VGDVDGQGVVSFIGTVCIDGSGHSMMLSGKAGADLPPIQNKRQLNRWPVKRDRNLTALATATRLLGMLMNLLLRKRYDMYWCRHQL